MSFRNAALIAEGPCAGGVILLVTFCGSTSLITGINQEMLPVLAETVTRIFRGKRLSLIVTVVYFGRVEATERGSFC